MSNQSSARLSIDVEPATRMRLKIAAARKGSSLREYCLQAILRQLDEEFPASVREEDEAWSQLSAEVFARDWDSEEDSVYDNLA